MFSEEVFEEREWGEERVERAVYEGCTFVRCRFDQTVFAECRLSECTFERCDLVGVRFLETVLERVAFEGGRAMGTDFTAVRTVLLAMRFRDVKLDLSNLAGLPLSGTPFRDCSLRDVVFDEADLRKATFTGSDLAGASFRHARLARADLRETRSATLDVGTARLDATRVDVETALVALRDLGLRCDALEEMFGTNPD